MLFQLRTKKLYINRLITPENQSNQLLSIPAIISRIQIQQKSLPIELSIDKIGETKK
jgi:hypothetical protein